MFWKSTLFLSIISTILNYVYSTNCRGDLLNCIMPFLKYEKETKTLFQPYNETELNEVCVNFYKVNTCVKDVTSRCGEKNSNSATIWLGVEDAFQYICEEGKNIFLKHRRCFASKDTQAAGEKCNNILHVAEPVIKGKKGGSSNRQSNSKYTICSMMYKFVDCVESAVEASCGAEIGHWQETVLRKTFSPTLDLADCPGINNAGCNRKYPTIIVCLVVSIYLYYLLL